MGCGVHVCLDQYWHTVGLFRSCLYLETNTQQRSGQSVFITQGRIRITTLVLFITQGRIRIKTLVLFITQGRIRITTLVLFVNQEKIMLLQCFQGRVILNLECATFLVGFCGDLHCSCCISVVWRFYSADVSISLSAFTCIYLCQYSTLNFRMYTFFARRSLFIQSTESEVKHHGL